MSKKCEHGRRKTTCKECGGGSICEHNRLKTRCKECGGGSICEHEKRRTQCKECHGSAFCEHGKQKPRCKECGGSAICEHDRQKSECKKCGGSSFCKHGRKKTICKECGGSSICEHDRQKSKCKECGGGSICEHGREKSICKECGGSAICVHGKHKSSCKECGGSALCKHDKHKSFCKECGGSAFCKHDRHKTRCKECGGSSLCKTELCETRGMSKYNGYCLPCCINFCPEIQVLRNYKTKEKNVVDSIKETFPNFTWFADKRVQDGCSKRRPDLLLDMGSHIIIVEIDENQHNNYDCSCEHKRLMLLSQDVGHRCIVFIRFNPDSYINQEGVLVNSCWKLNKLGFMIISKSKKEEWDSRIDILKQQIQYWIDNPTEKTIEIIELFY